MAPRINLKWRLMSLNEIGRTALIAHAISVHLMRLDGAQDKEAVWRMSRI